MENPAAAPPPRPPERLRWLDLVPVLLFTVLGVILVIALVVTLARLSRSFYQANLATIGLTAALGVYLAFGTGIAVALRRLRTPLAFLGLHWPTPHELALTLLLIVPWYMGVVLALIYAWTRSLTNTVLLHSLNNAVGTVAVYVLLTRSVS